MTVPSGPIPTFPNYVGLQDGKALNKLAQQLGSTQYGVVAKAGGGKTSATNITATFAEVATVATTSDSVKLPPGYPGLQVIIANAGAQTLQVFGAGSDTINGVATGTGVSQATGITALYKCVSVVSGVGKWYRILSA